MTPISFSSAPLIVTILLAASRDTEALSGTIYNVDPAGSGAQYGAGHVVQYVHYTSLAAFSQARAVCRALGGDLAKIETSAKQSWIRAFSAASIFDSDDLWTGLVEDERDAAVWVSDCFSDTAGVTFSSVWGSTKQCVVLMSSNDNDDLWTGLVEDEPGAAVWVSDCSSDTAGVTISNAWEPSKQCVILVAGTLVEFDRKGCEERYKFLCELSTVVTLGDLGVSPSYTSSSEPDAQCYTTTTSTTTTTTPTTTTTTTTQTSTTPATTWPITFTTTTPASTVSATITSSSDSTTPTVSPSPAASSSTTAHTSTTISTATSQQPSCGYASSSNCVCVQLTNNVSVADAVAIAEAISKNLTIDAKKTSSHRRTLTCAEDTRPSSQYLAVSGAIMVAAPFTFVVVSDLVAVVNSIIKFQQKSRAESTA